MHLDVGFSTHQGRVRGSNQDSVGVFMPSGGLFREAGPPLFIVADGMGGHRGGETASRLAAQSMGEIFQRKIRNASPVEALQVALLEANQFVLDQSNKTPELKDMGTTVVAATVAEEAVYIVNVGDSRAYFLRGEEFYQVTQDHSLVAEQVRMGRLTAEQAASSKRRNVITRAVGRYEDLEVDLFEEPWQPGDAFVLCSDGLWGPVSDAQIQMVVQEMEAQPAAEKLVQMTMIGQAPDNVSVVVVRRLE